VARALRRIGPTSVVMVVMVVTLARRTLPVHQLVAGGVAGRFAAGAVAPGMVMVVVVVVMAVVVQ